MTESLPPWVCRMITRAGAALGLVLLSIGALSAGPAATGVTGLISGCDARVGSTVFFYGTNRNEQTVYSRSTVVAKSGAETTVTLPLPRGGYTGGFYLLKRCRAEVAFGVLDGDVRPLNVRMAPFAPKNGGENDVYYPPHGDVAGNVNRNGVSVWLASRGGTYQAVRHGPLYYFDNIPAGRFTFHMAGNNWQTTHQVVVPANFRLSIYNW